MSAFIPEGYGEIAFKFSLTGDPQDMLMTLGFRPADPETADLADLEAAALAIGAGFQSDVIGTAADIIEGWSYLGFKFAVRPQGAADPVQGIGGTPVVGTQTEETPPVNVALLIQKYTNSGGRGGRGRMYAPPYALREGAISKQGVFTELSRAALDAQYSDFLQNVLLEGIGFPVVLHSMILTPGSDPPVYTEPGAPPHDITAFHVDSLVATQRRRLRP